MLARCNQFLSSLSGMGARILNGFEEISIRCEKARTLNPEP